MPIQLRKAGTALAGDNGEFELHDTDSGVYVRVLGQNGHGEWCFSKRRANPDGSRNYLEVLPPEIQQMQAASFEEYEGYPAPDWWYAQRDNSAESNAIAERLCAHWREIANRYVPHEGVIEEWESI